MNTELWLPHLKLVTVHWFNHYKYAQICKAHLMTHINSIQVLAHANKTIGQELQRAPLQVL